MMRAEWTARMEEKWALEAAERAAARAAAREAELAERKGTYQAAEDEDEEENDDNDEEEEDSDEDLQLLTGSSLSISPQVERTRSSLPAPVVVVAGMPAQARPFDQRPLQQVFSVQYRQLSGLYSAEDDSPSQPTASECAFHPESMTPLQAAAANREVEPEGLLQAQARVSMASQRIRTMSSRQMRAATRGALP